MSVTINDIQKHLLYGGVENKSVEVGEAAPRKPEVVAVTFLLELVSCGPVPYGTVEHNFRSHHGLTEQDHLLRYGVESVDDGVALCRDLCAAYDLPFGEGQEKKLRRKAGKAENLLLFVVERPLVR